MAKLTPDEILKLSEPIEQVYSNIVDALLVNMAKHFNSGNSLSTEQWEIRKLAELGQLNRESLRIIAELTGQNPELVQVALENAVYAATKDVEPELKEAVKKGKIEAAAAENVIASKSITQALSAYEEQAQEKLNLVNTTMLESTLAQYRKIITNTVNIERQMQAAQNILNTQTGRVVTGTASRTEALRQALSQIHKEGITGFVDKAGRKWSPEAYVNMDIRTTVHNTAIESVKLRQEDYGVEIFQVSRHSGARPLCYPYQGRYFSWNNSSGTFTDGAGKQHRYYPISSTSYGKPAGLFGINCGHDPITVIPGVTIPVERTTQNKEENDRVYAESQEQRRLEREIRYAKQKAAMMDAAGDKEGFAKEAVKIKQKQAAYNAFCKKTGRTKRLDRTQVFDYNKSVSSKATAAKRTTKADVSKTSNLQQAFKSNRSYIRDNGAFDIETAKNDYSKFIEQTPERVRPVLRYVYDSTPFVETQNKNVVFAYSPKQEAILYNPKSENFNELKFGTAATHELGHRIDDMFKFTENNETLTAAVDAAARMIEKKRGQFVDYSWKNDEEGFLSDILSAIDMSDLYLAGHPPNYWQRPGIREAEIYANLFSLETGGDKKTLRYLRENFPEIMQEYDKMKFEV